MLPRATPLGVFHSTLLSYSEMDQRTKMVITRTSHLPDVILEAQSSGSDSNECQQ